MRKISIRRVLGAFFAVYFFFKLVFSGGHFNAGGLVVFGFVSLWVVGGVALLRWLRRPTEVIVVRDERRQ
jgi:hypothetical protein